MIFNGKELAEKLKNDLKKRVAQGKREPGLAAIIIGTDPALKKFVNIKKKFAQDIGVRFSSYEIADTASVKEIEDTMQWLAHDEEIQGILVELPVPKQFNAQKIIDLIPPEKDIDVLTTKRESSFFQNDFSILPPAVGALRMFLDDQKIHLNAKKVAVFGQGRLVGKPISYWLEKQGATVFAIDKNTKQPGRFSQKADIVISGVGKPGLVTGDIIQQDAIVVDFGYGRKGKQLLGDIDFETVAPKASLVTPVPGGMGPLVVVAVIENLLALAE